MKNVVVIGANGAIGSEFMRQFINNSEVNKIYAYSRTKVDFESEKVTADVIDFNDESTIARAAEIASANAPLDLVIVATGILHDEDIMPEKSLRDLSARKFMHVYMANTIGPALIMKYFLPKLNHESRSVFAVLSARVGSISDNYLGGWYSYRASKCALNMIIKNASIEIGRRYKENIIIGLHPGTVNSKLSKPFQNQVPADHLFTPEYAVSQMIKVIENLTPNASGKLIDYEGKEIAP